MRVALVSASGPSRTVTGVSVYVSGLVGHLAARGHDVRHLRTAGTGDLAALVGGIRAIAPDIIHIHDLVGLPPAFGEELGSLGVPVIVTLHDFTAFCRRLVLVRANLQPCSGSEGGRNCAQYCGPYDPQGRAGQLLAALPAGVRSVLAPVLQSAAGAYRAARGGASSQFISRPASNDGDFRAPASLEDLTQRFAARAEAYRQSLLAASALLPVSEFTRRMYVAHGYPAEKLEVLPLSTPTLDRIRWRLRRFRGYPILFGFVGRVSPFKGAHVLAAAVRGIPPQLAEFHLFGSVRPEDRRYLSNLSGLHPGVVFHGGYSQESLPEILDRIDVLILPSIQQETVGLVGLEAQAAGLPIIGANVGAIPEYAHHEVNGLLFDPGNSASLRTQIDKIVRGPHLIGQFSANVVRPAGMASHVSRLLTVYEKVLSSARSTLGSISVGTGR